MPGERPISPEKIGLPPEEIKTEKSEGQVEAKEVAPEALGEKLDQEAQLGARLEKATGGQKDEVYDILNEAGIETKGKSPGEIADETEKTIPPKTSLLKRMLKTAILSTIGIGLGGSLSSAVAQEAKSAIKIETEKGREEKMNLKQAVEICKSYVDSMATIKGLSQAEGDTTAEYMIKAARIAIENGQGEDDFKKVLDDMMAWLKHVKNERPGLNAGLDAMVYGLERIVSDTSKQPEVKPRAESAFEVLDNDTKAMDAFLILDATHDQRMEALKKINIPDGGSVELNGIKIGRKGDKFYWIKYGNMGVELNEERTQKLVDSYHKAQDELLSQPK